MCLFMVIYFKSDLAPLHSTMMSDGTSNVKGTLSIFTICSKFSSSKHNTGVLGAEHFFFFCSFKNKKKYVLHEGKYSNKHAVENKYDVVLKELNEII